MAAAGVAFFAFYTLIPTLAVLIVTYGMFGGGDDVHARMRELGDVFPDEAMQALFGQMMDTAKDTGTGFGWGLFGSLMVLVWSGLFGMRALMAALNHAYHEVETRGFFKLNGMALLLCFGSFVLAAGMIGILTAGPFLLQDPALDPLWSKIFLCRPLAARRRVDNRGTRGLLPAGAVPFRSPLALGRLGRHRHRHAVDGDLRGFHALCPADRRLRDGVRLGGRCPDADDLALPAGIHRPARRRHQRRDGA